MPKTQHRRRTNRVLRAADRLLGVPTLWLLSLVRQPREIPVPESIKTIGLLKTACIGDTVLLSAAASGLRRAYPHARIILFAGPDNAQVVSLIPAIDEAVTLPVTSPVRAMRLVRSHPVDVMIDFGAWPRIDALLTRMARSRFTLGFATPGQSRHAAYDLVVPHSTSLHEIDNYRALVTPLGFSTTHSPALRVPTMGRPVWLPPADFAVCHAFSMGYRAEAKEWPVRYWVELANALRRRGLSVLITGSADDRERAEALRDAIVSSGTGEGGDVIVAAGRATLSESAYALERASVVVSVNTGLMHMACALGTPTVSLDGPVVTARWGPLGTHALAIAPQDSEAAYISMGHESPPHVRGQQKTADVMASITPTRVIEAVERVMKPFEGTSSSPSTMSCIRPQQGVAY